MNQNPVFLLPGLRSPFAKIDGELSSFDPLALSAPVIEQTVAGGLGLGRDRAGEIDLVIWGSVIPSLSVSNWAREAWFEAGLDPSVPALSVVQACATSIAAATYGAGQVVAGRARLALCGGTESASHAGIGLSPGLSQTIGRMSRARGPRQTLKTLAGLRPRDFRLSIPAVEERTTGKTMGQHAEEMASEWGVGREEQDRFALGSHQQATRDGGSFFRPLLVKPGTFPVDWDTVPRAHTSMDKLARLKPAFDSAAGTLTAGNSSPLTDGAAACWIASEAGLSLLSEELPRVKLLDWDETAINPRSDGLLIAPALGIARLLARHGLSPEDIQLWEIHEAFSAQVLCTLAALENQEWLGARSPSPAAGGAIPPERINPNGGSIALGHPFGATGARILSQAATELSAEPPGTRAIVSVCAAGGLGHVVLLEAV